MIINYSIKVKFILCLHHSSRSRNPQASPPIIINHGLLPMCKLVSVQPLSLMEYPAVKNPPILVVNHQLFMVKLGLFDHMMGLPFLLLLSQLTATIFHLPTAAIKVLVSVKPVGNNWWLLGPYQSNP